MWLNQNNIRSFIWKDSCSYYSFKTNCLPVPLTPQSLTLPSPGLVLISDSPLSFWIYLPLHQNLFHSRPLAEFLVRTRTAAYCFFPRPGPSPSFTYFLVCHTCQEKAGQWGHDGHQIIICNAVGKQMISYHMYQNVHSQYLTPREQYWLCPCWKFWFMTANDVMVDPLVQAYW